MCALTLMVSGGCSDKKDAQAAGGGDDVVGDTGGLVDVISDADSSDEDSSAPDTSVQDSSAQDTVAQDSTGADAGAGDSATTDAQAGDSGAADASQPDTAAPDAGPIDPCVGETCGGHGSCFSVYDVPVCTCDPGYFRLGLLQCVPESTPSPCNPNPCKAPDQGVCTEIVGAGATKEAKCGCDVGFSEVNGLCVFATCPKVSAFTGVTLYDQTGGSVVGGFDPLVAKDVVKVRVDIRVTNGGGKVTLELHLTTPSC